MGRKKGSGQGSLYKRGNKWRGQIMVNGVRYSYSSELKTDVINWLAKIRFDADLSSILPENNITVKELADQWFVMKEATVSPQTIYKTEKLFESHLYPVLGEYRVQSLTTKLIEESYPKMFSKKVGKKYKECNYCYSTVKLFYSKFKALLKYAVDESIILSNPHDKVVLPRCRKPSKVSAYTLEEQLKIIEFTKNGETIDKIFYLLVATGMRLGEVLALTWSDVDLENKIIKVNKTAVNYRGTMLIQNHPKTEQSVRNIYLSDNTTKVLKLLYEGTDGLMFANEKGKVYHTSALRSRWIRDCDKMKITYRGIHSLRHSFATRALEKGIDIKTVSNILGHTSVITTMNIYQDVYDEQKRKAAKIMNDVV